MSGDGASVADLLPRASSRAVAVITMDSQGVIVEFSDQAEAMLGYRRGDAVGCRMSEVIIPPRLRTAHETGLARYLATGVGPLFDQAFELPALHADGREILVELVVTPVRAGGELVFTGFLREVEPAQSTVSGELAVAEAFFRTLVARSPIAISVVEPDGQWRWSSEAGMRLHGPLGGAHAAPGVVPPADDARLLALIRKAASEKTKHEPVDVRVRGLDGNWHSLTVAAENMLTEPAVHGIGLYATDTTRLYEAEQRVKLEGARLGTLISSLGVGILLQDAAHHVVLVNSAFTELFGVAAQPADLVGRPITDLVTRNPFAEQEGATARGFALLEAGVPATGEEYTLADGRVVERDYVPVHLDGATHGHLWVFRDVTGQSQIRRGLEESNRALAELASLKTEFIATASHELRTPLTSILTFAHLLEEPGAGPAEHTRALGAITRNADRMLRLVDDLILLATLEAGTAPLRLMPVDLPELVASAIETWRPVAAGMGITLTDERGKGPRAQADTRHLHQLIDTLLGTAVARTPRMGRIAVTVSYDDPSWTIRLASSGSSGTGGDHIFTRPGRHDDPSAAHSNALALLLSRSIVARHGGEMISPNEERGMVYVVSLPLVPPETAG